MRHRLPWPLVIAGGAGLLAVLVAWGEVHNWGIFLQFLYHVPYGANDPLYDKDIGFYLFALPAYVRSGFRSRSVRRMGLAGQGDALEAKSG